MRKVHCSKERKLLKSMKFPKEYSLKVDVKKVNWEIMREWTALRVTQLLGMEDEVLIGYIHEQLGEDKKVGSAHSRFSCDADRCTSILLIVLTL